MTRERCIAINRRHGSKNDNKGKRCLHYVCMHKLCLIHWDISLRGKLITIENGGNDDI